MRRVTSVVAGVAHLVGPGTLKVLNGHLAYSQTRQPPLRLDPAALTSLACYGEVSVSGAAMDLLFRHNIPTAWLTPAGTRCRGRLSGADTASTLTRIRQHRVFGRPGPRLEWAKDVVVGKIEAMAIAARHYQRHGTATAGPLMARLSDLASRIPAVETNNQLLGLEGSASAAWFDFFATLIQPPWSFPGRTRRPPTDPVNALLSLGYTFLLTRMTARGQARGYEINLGGLHEYRAGRPSLACDLIEPLRVPAVDRWVVSVCNQQELSPAQFQVEENGGYRLHPDQFGRTVQSWEAFWASAALGKELERWLDRLTDLLKRCDEPPTDGQNPSDDL